MHKMNVALKLIRIIANSKARHNHIQFRKLHIVYLYSLSNSGSKNHEKQFTFEKDIDVLHPKALRKP